MKKDFFKIGKLSGKATAAVLCCCMAAAAAVGVYNYNKTRLAAEKQLTGTSDAAASPAEERSVDAQIVQNDVPKAELPVQDLMPGNADDVFADSLPEPDAEPVGAEPDEPAEPAAVSTGDPAEADGMGIMIRPLDGELVNPYSNGDLVKSRTLNVWRTHDGVDIAGEIGESVRAAAAGTVCSVYRDTMWGNCVEIEHSGGFMSCYFGLGDDIAVSEGDPVNAGTVIGTVGESAECESSEKPHLHFALKKNGAWTDPTAAVSGEGS